MSTLKLSIDEARAMGLPIPAAVVKKQPKFQERKSTDRFKSKWERLYAMELDDQRKLGLINRWEYEPFGIRLDDGAGKHCIWWPDFAVWNDAGLEFHEIKGKGKFALRPAARVKFLAAKRLYPEFSFCMLQRDGNGWNQIL